jgi:hypothetical protein
VNCNSPARCRWWSERVARYDENYGEVHAVCLCRESPRYGQFTSAQDGCREGEEGEPVDMTAPATYLPRAAGEARDLPGALSLQANADLKVEPHPSEGQEKLDLHPTSPWVTRGRGFSRGTRA